MIDHHQEIDSALSEVERIRKLLARLKVPQIRNSEHRDILKATALSWFRNHRVQITDSISGEMLEAIDKPYQCILDATDRASAKSTYVSAVKAVKESLLKARTVVLVTPPTSNVMDTVPDFTPLASDVVMQTILTRRWEECSCCLTANAPLAATVMMGGLLEALFVSRANKLSDKNALFASSVAPIDPRSKKPLELRQWTLGPFIDVGHDLKWISRSAKDIAVVLRDYRNYIHPEKERSHGVVLSADDAAMMWGVTKTLCRELLAMKGTV